MLKHSRSGPTFLLSCIAATQLVVGCMALIWALPLFVDPPFLGNGATQDFSSLRSINSASSEALGLLATLQEKTSWLFEHYSEGVLIALVAGAFLMLSGSAAIIALIWLRKIARRQTARA